MRFNLLNRTSKRLFFALLISGACFTATVIWFYSGQSKGHHHDGKAAVARLSDATNEVQRREAKRVIWETIGRDDDLFAGERVRTTATSDARILLVKSGTIIRLEPDSEIVIEENDSGLALNFLQGNLFVQGGGQGVTLTTGAGEINLAKADMSLSKDGSGAVSLEVYKGQAELQQNGKTLALGKDKSAVLSDQGLVEGANRLLVLTPEAGETRLLNLSLGEKLEFAWTPLSEGYQVSLELGATRGALKTIANAETAGSAGHLKLAQKAGKWMARLRARSKDPAQPELVSMIFPFTIEPISAPQPVEPSREAAVVAPASAENVNFRWISRNHFAAYILEVAKDAAFKNVVTTTKPEATAQNSARPLKPGDYFWRITGTLDNKGHTQTLVSDAVPFHVVDHLDIKAASLIAPADRAHIAISEAQRPGINLKWQTLPGISLVHVVAEKAAEGTKWKTIYDDDVEANSLRLSQMKPGHYRWKVIVPDAKGPGPVSAQFEFGVDDLPKLDWALGNDPSEYLYATPTPSLAAQWKAKANASAYRFRILEGDAETEWQTSKSNNFETEVKADGVYRVKGQALDRDNEPIAESSIKTFTVKRLPLLSAPRWADNTPPYLKTDGRGNLSFSWEPVEGAKQYLMILKNADGNKVEERSVSRNTASVNRLKPGRYQVQLKAIDAQKRPGELGELKRLDVPATNDIKGPKIKAVKVK